MAFSKLKSLLLCKRRLTLAASLVLFNAAQPCVPQNVIAAEAPLKFPYPESLIYHVTWRLITAGQAVLRFTPGANNGWQMSLNLTTSGLVNQLYHVLDNYKLSTTDKFCATNVDFDAQEGKRRATTLIGFDYDKRKLEATSKDLVANTTHTTELDIQPCTYEIAGALMTLRASQLQPGSRFMVPVTDGKKLANVRVEGLMKEKITVNGKAYNTIRYETFVFDNVLYRRKGRLLIWITDDQQRLPVQMRFLFGFPLGDVTLDLDKVERL